MYGRRMCEREKQSAFWISTHNACVDIQRRRGPAGTRSPRCYFLPCTGWLYGFAMVWTAENRESSCAELLRELLLHMLTFCHTVYRGELMFVAALHDLVHWD